MSYSKEAMTGDNGQERREEQEPIEEDPRFEEEVQQYYKELGELLPNLTSEQAIGIRRYAEKLAIDSLRFKRNALLLGQENEALRQRTQVLEPLVGKDSLTELDNRRRFDERIAAEVSKAAREGTPFCLIMLDIDGFKEYNDSQGHPAGDEVLIQVGDAIKKSTRLHDGRYRNGGDEYAVLSEVKLSAAVGIAQRIVNNVFGLGIKYTDQDGQQRQVTVSAGVSEYQSISGLRLNDPDKEVKGLEVNADQSLYAAKGNRSIVAFMNQDGKIGFLETDPRNPAKRVAVYPPPSPRK